MIFLRYASLRRQGMRYRARVRIDRIVAVRALDTLRIVLKALFWAVWKNDRTFAALTHAYPALGPNWRSFSIQDWRGPILIGI